jgi:transcriptional regulator with XRE-family HTH domain
MTTKHDELMLDPEYRKLYAIEGLIADTAQMIWELLERKDMRQADLARLLNKTPAFVSQLLNGKANMTVRTLAEVVYTLGATVEINAHDESTSRCEAVDDSQMQTFSAQMPMRVSDPYSLDWEKPGIIQSKSPDFDSRPGVAA